MIIDGYDFGSMKMPSSWVRLSTDFFDRPVMKKLSRHAGGSEYIVLYQKIMLYSAQWGGFLPVQYEASLSEELSLVVDANERDMNVLLSFLEANGLLNRETDRVFLLTEVPKMVGRDDSSDRVRRFRERQKQLANGGAEQPKKIPMTSKERVQKHRESKKKLPPKTTQNQPKKGSLHAVTCNEDGDFCNADVTTNLEISRLPESPCNTAKNPYGTAQSAEQVIDLNLIGDEECNADVTPCNENVTKSPLHVTFDTVTTDHKNVTIVTDETSNNPQDLGIYACNEICNVTETLHPLHVTPKNKIESKNINTGGNARAYEGGNELSTDEIASLHETTIETLREYISFRLNSGDIVNPIGFERSLMKNLSDVSSQESNVFETWMRCHIAERLIIDYLVKEFMSCSSIYFDRKYCREIAKDDFTLKQNHIVPNDIAIEIAFQEAKEKRDQRMFG